MRYKIRLGVPEMEEYWKMLSQKVCEGIANKNERKEYRQIGKAMCLLANNPRHPSLNSHEIKILSIRYKQKVFESFLKIRHQLPEGYFGRMDRTNKILQLLR